MDSEEILYSIALRRSPNIGNITFALLVNSIGSAKEVWQISKQHLTGISGIGNTIAKSIGNEEYIRFAEKEIKFCEQNKIKIRLKHLGQLPTLLNECDDAPAILYQKGSFDETTDNISIVGTRKSTSYGKEFLSEFISQVSKKNVQIISGLALGTDGIAHQEALKNKLKTSAILAHGLHMLYPSKHRMLAQQILENGGALFSEFTSADKPDREHFLQRNRIVAGLSHSTIVVESAYAGGSISTATFANQYNREVYALPGRINDTYSQGCNLLIFQNKAKIIHNISSLIEDLGLSSTKTQIQELFPKHLPTLTPNQEHIYSIIKNTPQISLDDIALIADETTFKLLPILLELEILGVISANSGRKYSAKI